MPQLGFEPMILVFERAKTVHASDRVATVIGSLYYCPPPPKYIYKMLQCSGPVVLSLFPFECTPFPPSTVR
jgi:hypothetical protein